MTKSLGEVRRVSELLVPILLRRMHALKDFSPNLGIVLRHLQNRRIFLDREALIRDCLGKGSVRLSDNALLIGLRRLRQPLSIGLLKARHVLKGRCRRVEFLFRNLRCGSRRTRRRGLALSVLRISNRNVRIASRHQNSCRQESYQHCHTLSPLHGTPLAQERPRIEGSTAGPNGCSEPLWDADMLIRHVGREPTKRGASNSFWPNDCLCACNGLLLRNYVNHAHHCWIDQHDPILRHSVFDALGLGRRRERGVGQEVKFGRGWHLSSDRQWNIL